ncbi:MAG: response regulator [Planctomycetes bacterium]|nr:response regulator [Planctomycetota bacterium]
MSLTWKLIFGFLFALVLQVAQMLTSGYFTAKMQAASGQVSDALTACLAVQGAIDAVRDLQQRVDAESAGKGSFDVAVGRVYLEEVQRQASALAGPLDASDRHGLEVLRRCLSRAGRGLEDVAAAPVGESRKDALLYLTDDLGEVEQALSRAQVRLRAVGLTGIEAERVVHDLPFRGALLITLAGVLVMALFVVWYRRQMVVPIQLAWAELEQRVQDRTAELAAARDAADAANQTKTAFLANISHELRTPMTAILGYSDLLADGGSGPDAARLLQESVATIRRNAQAMVAIVNDLLDMSKLEAGKLQVERIACSPLQVVDDVLGLLRTKAAARKVVLRSVVPEPVPEQVQTDPLRLRQVLINLVDNAIKFSDGGEVTVTVSFAGAGDAAELQFEVADRGIGMPASVLARLFQPFEQADVSTTRRYGGTGLGLAISRQLARLLGGDLVAASAVGHGSRFRLTVATGAVDGVPRAKSVRAEGVPAADTSRPLAGVTVLVVEDGPDNQRLLRHLLERAGCTIELVGNGQLCLDRMAAPAATFDVVLMDMQMPVMDGITATRALRQRGCRVPIVSLTANAMQADREACLAAGCDAFLTKPIDRKKLLATIAEWRGRRCGVVAATT